MPTRIHNTCQRWFRLEQLAMLSANWLTIGEMEGLDLGVRTSTIALYSPVFLVRLTRDSVY